MIEFLAIFEYDAAAAMREYRAVEPQLPRYLDFGRLVLVGASLLVRRPCVQRNQTFPTASFRAENDVAGELRVQVRYYCNLNRGTLCVAPAGVWGSVRAIRAARVAVGHGADSEVSDFARLHCLRLALRWTGSAFASRSMNGRWARASRFVVVASASAIDRALTRDSPSTRWRGLFAARGSGAIQCTSSRTGEHIIPRTPRNMLF